jgi:hypothetical protein
MPMIKTSAVGLSAILDKCQPMTLCHLHQTTQIGDSGPQMYDSDRTTTWRKRQLHCSRI